MSGGGGANIPRPQRPPSFPFGGGGSPAAGTGAGVSSIFPPNLYPPQGSTILFLQGRGDVTALAPSVSPTSLRFTVPLSKVLIISDLSTMILAPVDTSDCSWILTIDGNPAPNFPQSFSPQMRAASSLEQPFGPLGLQVDEGHTIGVTMQTNDGQPYTLSAQVYGWFFGRNLQAGAAGGP